MLQGSLGRRRGEGPELLLDSWGPEGVGGAPGYLSEWDRECSEDSGRLSRAPRVPEGPRLLDRETTPRGGWTAARSPASSSSKEFMHGK